MARRDTLEASYKTAASLSKNGSVNGSAFEPTIASPYVGAHGVEPSPWIVELPWALRSLIIYFFVDILRPNEDFIVVLRKLVLTVGMLLCFSPSTVAIYNCVTIDDSTSSAALVAKILVFFFMVAWIVPYLLVRFSDGRDELAADIWVFSTWLLVSMMAISFIEWPHQESFVLIVVVAQLFRTRLMPLQMICCIVSHIIADFNHADFIRGQPEFTLWALPGAIMRGFATRMLFSVTSLGTCVLVLTALQLQLMESDRQTKVSRASAELAQQVSELLSLYDTRSAKSLLEAANESKECNPVLIDSLRLLIANLDKYRPHIPNWLLPEGVDAVVEMGQSSVHDGATTPTTDRRSDSFRPGSSRRQTVQSGTKDEPSHEAGRFGDGGWLAPCVAQTAQISMAYVEFGFLNKDRVQEAANEWVQWVHREAAATSGAVHCFVGDVVVMSWNAASRAIQNEVKAARLLARAAAYGRENGVALTGAAMSGSARVQLAGGERMQALTIHAAWKRGTEPLLKLARDTKAMIVDHRTRGNSHFGIRYRAACAVTIREPSSLSAAATPALIDGMSNAKVHRIGAFEVLGEANDDGGDEWMYVLEKNHSANDQVNADAVQRNHAIATGLQEWARHEDARSLEALKGLIPTRESPLVLADEINVLCGSA